MAAIAEGSLRVSILSLISAGIVNIGDRKCIDGRPQLGRLIASYNVIS
jgi:hypothetical protein